MSVAEVVQTTVKPKISGATGLILQRKCVCGGLAGLTSECSDCQTNKLLGKPLSTNVRVTEPDDEYEREADRVAEEVMCMPDSTVQRTETISEPTWSADNEQQESERPIRQNDVDLHATFNDTARPDFLDRLGVGQPLDPAARKFFEPRFGQSLQDVRLHTDDRAQQATKSVHARAFTVGRHIVFGAGEYAPNSIATTALLAHELTHSIQQTGGSNAQSNTGLPTVSAAPNITPTHSEPVIARKTAAAFIQNDSTAVAEQVVANQIEPSINEQGPSSDELIRVNPGLTRNREQAKAKEVSIEEPAPIQTTSPVRFEGEVASEASETAAERQAFALESEPSEANASSGTATDAPSQVSRQFNVLPPSTQAETYAQLGATMSTSFENQAGDTQADIPELTASLEGVSELPVTPIITTPPLTPSIAGQVLKKAPDPVVKIPRAPEQPAVNQPALPTAQSVEPEALDQALRTIDPAPAIRTPLTTPKIPLEGNADPAALGTLEPAAASEAERALEAAQTGVTNVSPETVQPLALNKIVSAPTLPEVPASKHMPQVDGMDKLAGYALNPRDRSIVDAQLGPQIQEAATDAQSELDQHEQAFDQERTQLHLEANAEATAAQAAAQEDQLLGVEQGQQELVTEQQRILEQQEIAVDGALGELAKSKDASGQAITDQLAADRRILDEDYTATNADAQAKIEKGHAQAKEVKGATTNQVNASSWWDWAIDTWQAIVQKVAATVVAIWEGITQEVADLFDRAIQRATKVVNGTVNFLKRTLSAYFDLWTRLVDTLLGNVFPGLASAFKEYIDAVKARAFATLDTVAAAYLQTLRVVADTLVAGLYAALEVYKAGVAAYLALWEAIQKGQWADIGRTVLSAILTAAGIDPKEFFATFGKMDEVIDDIIADPALIGRNAVAALGLGFKQFGTNFIGNFTVAFVEWITGTAAIRLPKTFSIAGIFQVVCDVLNLTKAYLRQKAVQHLGEGAVTAVEELTEQAWAFVSEGWAGLWNMVKDKLTTLVDDVVVAMGTWLVEKAILVVGRWITGLVATMGFSLIVEALIALWQFIMWLKDQFQRFWMIVKSTVDSVHDFVKGKIGPAANKIEGTLQDLIVPAIDLVAKLLNIGNIAKKVENIIEAVRDVIDQAIDGVVKGLKKKFGFGRKENKGTEKEGEEEEAGRHGKITLGMLKEPPVMLPRTKEEELQDLAAAHKVLKLAEGKVLDTAALAEYFDPVKQRFRLEQLEYVEVGEQTAVLAKINPEMDGYYALDERDFAGNLPLDTTHVESKTKDITWQENGTSSSDTVATKMVAAPLGPDHRKGAGPKSSALRKIMKRLVTTTGNTEDKKYIKGHLLNDNVGGPGTKDNLYPITATANRNHEMNIEHWVKKQLKNRYYVYYKVEIVEGKVKLDGQENQNYVDSVIKAEAGYWKTKAPHWDNDKLIKTTIRSHVNIGRDAARTTARSESEEEVTTPRAEHPQFHRSVNLQETNLLIKSPSSQRIKEEENPNLERAKEAAANIRAYEGFIKAVAHIEGRLHGLGSASTRLDRYRTDAEALVRACELAVQQDNNTQATSTADQAEIEAQNARDVVEPLTRQSISILARPITNTREVDNEVMQIFRNVSEIVNGYEPRGKQLLTTGNNIGWTLGEGNFARLNEPRKRLGKIKNQYFIRARAKNTRLQVTRTRALTIIHRTSVSRTVESYAAATSISRALSSETEAVLKDARELLTMAEDVRRDLDDIALELARLG